MTKIKRKLIFYWTYLEWGGAQVYFMAIMKEAMPDWDVVVVLPKASSPEIIRYLEQIGAQCEFLDYHLDTGLAPTLKRKFQRQWSRISGEIATLRFLRRYNLHESILHIETCPWQSWIFVTILALRGANVFVTMHNAISTNSRWRRMVWKARMQFVSRLPGFHIFTSNHDTKNKIRDLVELRFWENIAVTYTCVDPLQIARTLDREDDRAVIRNRHRFGRDEFIVLAVGQFIDRKGRWTFLDAAKLHHAHDPETIFVWMTPVAPNEAEKERINDYGLGQNFRLILSGDVGSNREEILEFFRIADIFALPSFIEGLPIAILEAMALGLPTISTKVYAIPEAIRPGETGILVEAGDAAALEREIRNLKNDTALRQRLAETGSRYVLEHFDERVASRKAIAKYKECFDDAG